MQPNDINTDQPNTDKLDVISLDTFNTIINPISPNRSFHQKLVDGFMLLAKQELPAEPTAPALSTLQLRAELILEEAFETIEALGVSVFFDLSPAELQQAVKDQGVNLSEHRKHISLGPTHPFDLIKTIDGCTDLRVVTTGTLSAIGVPDLPMQRLTDVNNLQKFGPGSYVAEGPDSMEKPGPAGKLIKPPGHKAPPFLELLQQLYPDNPLLIRT